MRAPELTARQWWTVAAIATVVVLTGSLAPGEAAGGLPAGTDKLLHAAGYAAVAFAVAAARESQTAMALAAVVLGVSLFGAAVELVQPTVGRTASPMDAVANLVGATAGAAVWWSTAR